MRNQFFFILLLFCSYMQAQPGCTDPQATNYDDMATVNDGSCVYPATAGTLTLIASLPGSMEEISGLAHTSSGLWAHNDGGNENEVYEIDSLTGVVKHTALVIGDNIDWEDMAESNDHIYLGDFGNNPGNRMDLKIYQLSKSELGNNIMNTEIIEFTFSDQTDFSENWNDNDFDCEAFIYHNDSLHLFTKNWVNNQTRHYVLPAEPGQHVAQVRETFNVNGLITGADINEDGIITLVGYTAGGSNFIWILFDYSDFHYFSGNKRRIEMGTALTNSQTEGIAFKNKYEGYIGSEKFSVLPAKLLAFSIEDWVDNVPVSTSTVIDNKVLKVSPNPFDDALFISFTENQYEIVNCILVDALGQSVWSQNHSTSNRLELSGFSHLPIGLYTLIVQTKDGTAYRKVVKQ